MDETFILIAITPPLFIKNEVEIIKNILTQKTADYIHLRKPSSSAKDLECLIKKIPEKYHERLKIHDHFHLIDKYNLGGIHLNYRNPYPCQGTKSISVSLHNIEEINGADIYDYFFISPVFDSISKKEYKASFNMRKLESAIKNKKAIALGGVTPEKFNILKKMGFYGAAMLGHFFS